MPGPFPPRAVHGLIEEIYAAAADSSRWTTLLGVLRETVDGASAWLADVHVETGGISVTAESGVDHEVLRLYHERYAAIDPHFAPARLKAFEPGFTCLSQQLVGEAELLGSPFYERFGRAHGVISGLCSVVGADGPLRMVVSINRRSDQRFGEDESQLLQSLYPHFRNSFQIRRAVMHQLNVGRAAIATLNRMKSATFVCDGDSNVLHVNDAGQQLAPTLLKGNRLVFGNASDTNRLRGAIVSAAQAVQSGTAADIRMTVADASGITRTLVVAPVHQEAIRLVEPMVAVLISSPEVSQAALERTAQIFRLTPVEVRAAAILIDGGSVRDIATALGVTYESARTYVKRLLSKAGVRRQAELVKTLLTAFVE